MGSAMVFSLLNPYITDALSAPAATQLDELDPEAYDKMLGNDGMGLRVPADLDETICLYEGLSSSNREKFDRAAFWFSTSSRMWDISMSAAFAALVSAIESLTATGNVHDFTCPICGLPTNHRVPGPTKLFRNFLATYAPSASLAKERDDMYDLRSNLVHGGHVVELDREIPFMGWTPPVSMNGKNIPTCGDLPAPRCGIGSSAAASVFNKLAKCAHIFIGSREVGHFGKRTLTGNGRYTNFPNKSR